MLNTFYLKYNQLISRHLLEVFYFCQHISYSHTFDDYHQFTYWDYYIFATQNKKNIKVVTEVKESRIINIITKHLYFFLIFLNQKRSDKEHTWHIWEKKNTLIKAKLQ